MESIHKDSGKIKGVEVLYFEEAELEKLKSNSTSFAAIGPLSVLYFKDYHRFVLQLNDWKYPLLRRLSIIASDTINPNSRSYVLPAPNGFSFVLRLDKTANPEAVNNFETILSKNSRFSLDGEETPKHVEMSPDDKLKRKPSKETGPKEIVSEIMKSLLEKVRVSSQTFQTKTKNLTSLKKKDLVEGH